MISDHINLKKLDAFAASLDKEFDSGINIIEFCEQGQLNAYERPLFERYLKCKCDKHINHTWQGLILDSYGDGEYTYWIIRDVENIKIKHPESTFDPNHYYVEYRGETIASRTKDDRWSFNSMKLRMLQD